MIKECKKHHYIQLVGLLAMSKKYNQKLVDIVDAIQYVLEVTPEDGAVSGVGGVGDPGHINDAVYCDDEIKTLLENLGIPLEDSISKDCFV